MPSHWSSPRLNIVTPSSSTATQCLHADRLRGGRPVLRQASRSGDDRRGKWNDYRDYKRRKFQGDEVIYVSIGEGSTSQGEFWESLNTASNGKLPVRIVVEDNGYAISTPVEANTPGGNISQAGRELSQLPLCGDRWHRSDCELRGDGGGGGVLPRAARGRRWCTGMSCGPYSHSLSDDERQYRSEAEVQADALRDPIAQMQMWLLREGILDAEGITRLEREVDAEVQRAADRAVSAVLPRATRKPSSGTSTPKI